MRANMATDLSRGSKNGKKRRHEKKNDVTFFFTKRIGPHSFPSRIAFRRTSSFVCCGCVRAHVRVCA